QRVARRAEHHLRRQLERADGARGADLAAAGGGVRDLPEASDQRAVAGGGQVDVVLVGALDTKHAEYGFVRDRITAAGVPCLVVDTSVLGTPGIAADVDRRAVAQAAGADHEALADAGDRNAAVAAMARGAAAVVRDLHRAGRVAAVVVLGGSNAGFVMSEVAPVLPLGVPKVLVSTVVAGDTRPYVGTSDVTMIYPVVDVAGLNSVS